MGILLPLELSLEHDGWARVGERLRRRHRRQVRREDGGELLGVHGRLGARRAWSGVDGSGRQRRGDRQERHLVMMLLLLEVELGAGVRREVTVLPVLRVGIGTVVEERRRHCLSGHSVHHVSGDSHSCQLGGSQPNW